MCTRQLKSRASHRGFQSVLADTQENFDLERAILLAGFAFEAYNQPKG